MRSPFVVLTVDDHGVPDGQRAFAYSNLSDRRSGPLLSIGRRVIPGLGQVAAQIGPYAEEWRLRNIATLATEGSADHPQPLWVALGDSLSQGIGASSVERGWVPQVASALRAAGRPIRVVNFSVSGARTQELIDKQLPALDALGVVPDIVTVMIGSNDLIRRSRRAALPAQFVRLLELVPAGSLVATMPAPERGVGMTLNALVARAAERRGIVGVPYAGGPGMRAADHFHPNDAGYAALARPYVAAISDALRRGIMTHD